MKYLLRKEKGYYFGVVVGDNHKLRKKGNDKFVDTLVGNVLADQVVVDFDGDEPIYWTEAHELEAIAEESAAETKVIAVRGEKYSAVFLQLLSSPVVHGYGAGYADIASAALRQSEATPDATAIELFDAVVDALKPQENDKKNKAAK